MSHGGDGGLPEEHEEHVNHEAWVIPYADLLTLLMAMFIALFAMSTVDMDKFKSLSLGFNEALGGGELSTGVFDPSKGGDGPLDGEGNGVSPQDGGEIGPDKQPKSDSFLASLLQQKLEEQVGQAQEREALEGVQHAIEAAAEEGGFNGSLETRQEERGLVVTVVTDQVVFPSGSAQIEGPGLDILHVVGEALKSIDNEVIVEGHTDPEPIQNSVYRNNRDLSNARASSVVTYFESLGIDGARMSSVGWADKHPLPDADNSTVEGRARNRRVEIVVVSKQVQKVLEDNHLGNTPVDPSTDGVDTPAEERVDGGIDSIEPNLGTNGH
ncbi:MAG TPA: flagellar motor protein MotB [Acidimicrobiia bacterium]|nr:flagellar motor protein MotB [Acidimicrobiia bacterium]